MSSDISSESKYKFVSLFLLKEELSIVKNALYFYTLAQPKNISRGRKVFIGHFEISANQANTFVSAFYIKTNFLLWITAFLHILWNENVFRGRFHGNIFSIASSVLLTKQFGWINTVYGCHLAGRSGKNINLVSFK